MAEKYNILQEKSDEYITLLSVLETDKSPVIDKQKVIETIQRVLIHSSITIDCLINE